MKRSAGGRVTGQRMLKSSMSPQYRDQSKGSLDSLVLQQAQAKRQIDLTQMLTDLRQSIRDRDSNMILEQ